MKPSYVLKKIMGDDVFESLHKALLKLPTQTVHDPEELYNSIRAVPKAIISFLMRELRPLEENGSAEIELPWCENSTMLVNKKAHDVYNGEIWRDGKIVHTFEWESIPSLGGHLMSLFELYDDAGRDEGEVKEETPEQSKELMQQQIKTLEAKIDNLMLIVSNKNFTPNNFEKSEDNKKEYKKLFRALKSQLKKDGLMPKMPNAPGPGTNVGGKQGISQKGIKGDKTEASDYSTRQSKMKDPNMKKPDDPGLNPKTQAQQLKLGKNEDIKNIKCPCDMTMFSNGSYVGCPCYKALSEPQILKKKDGTTVAKFKKDWDKDSIVALYRAIKKVPNE